MANVPQASFAPTAPSGVKGLDEILRGGFPRDEIHLVQGSAGTGKTTFGLHFLLEGARTGEAGLYITLAQSKAGLERIARSHGWSLEKIHIYELSPGTIAERIATRQTVVHTADVELGELMQGLGATVEQIKPVRVIFDSIGVLRLLAGTSQGYHREIVTLKHLLANGGSTTLFMGDQPSEDDVPREVLLHPLFGCAVQLDQSPPDYGEIRRRIRVIKTRGMPFSTGYHNFSIRTGIGIEVYPRLGIYSPSEPAEETVLVASGIQALDELLGGGLEEGTGCLILGPPGSGKSTLASVYTHAALERGENASIFLFEERPETFIQRSAGLGLVLKKHIDQGRLKIEQLNTAEISPGEFAHRIRQAVEEHQATVVVIDSLSGYVHAMPNDRMLIPQMHEMLNYLSHRGVLSILIISAEGFLSIKEEEAVNVSYLSDTVLMLRLFEAGGAVRRCIAAIKKRHGEHQTTIRELILRAGAIHVGEPLHELRGILSGHPMPDGGEIERVVQQQANPPGAAGRNIRKALE